MAHLIRGGMNMAHLITEWNEHGESFLLVGMNLAHLISDGTELGESYYGFE